MAAKKKPLSFSKSIEKSHLKKGKFTDWAKAHGFNGVTQAAIAAGKKSKSPTVKKEAVLAETFKKIAKKHKDKKK